ncbi:MAG TPA: small, acid-soluble spore protein, alpha/beta type [Candidatus Scybalomonas excrementigallinarum]|nr:small, acid-soluble spore protein, alpha/beta type [Candidatus Scybalomonas excrementigallinarum]
MSKNNTKKELKMIRNSMSLEQLSKDQKMKYEIAKELGLYDKVIEHGWKSLSAKETGKIGGIMTRKKKEEEREKKRGVSVEDIDTDIDGINDVLKHEDSPKL